MEGTFLPRRKRSTVKITCSAKSFTLWFHKPSKFSLAVNKRSSQSTVDIYNAQYSDTGYYYCYGSNEYGHLFLDKIYIYIYGKYYSSIILLFYRLIYLVQSILTLRQYPGTLMSISECYTPVNWCSVTPQQFCLLLKAFCTFLFGNLGLYICKSISRTARFWHKAAVSLRFLPLKSVL